MNLSVVHVKGIGVFENARGGEYDGEFIEKSNNMVKLEIFCSRGASEQYVKIIQGYAKTGKSGDGAILSLTLTAPSGSGPEKRRSPNG